MLLEIQQFFSKLWVRIALIVASFGWQLYIVTYGLTSGNHFSDEPIYVSAGWSYVTGDFTANLEHPPTAKYLIGFAQQLWGQGFTSGRIMAAIFVLLAAAVLGWMVSTEGGLWVGLIAANLFVFMPQRFQNFAATNMLEPFMVCFLVFAFAAAWLWQRTGHWWLMLLAGAFFGFAVTSKITAAVAVVAFIAVFINRHHWAKKIAALALFAAGTWASVWFAYLQIGYDRGVTYMTNFQNHHNEVGHYVFIAGEPYMHTPWWAVFWNMVVEAGWPLVLTWVLLTLVTLVWRPSVLAIFLGLGAFSIAGFYAFVSHISLPHYFIGYSWALAGLSGLGLARLWRWANQEQPAFLRLRISNGSKKAAARTLAILASLLVAISLAISVEVVHRVKPFGLALVWGELVKNHAEGNIYVVGEQNNLNDYLLGHWASNFKHQPYSAIYVGDDPRFAMDPIVAHYISKHKKTLEKVSLGHSTYVLISKIPIHFHNIPG